MFCKACLDKYFQNNVARKSCPECRQSGLSKQTMRSSQFASRLINALKVKCELECGWNGSLSDLQQHSINHCPLYQMKCNHCKNMMTRTQLDSHQCPEEKIKCDKCEIKVLRKNMNNHKTVCSQKWLYNKGNMKKKHREIISKVLQDRHDDIEDIRNRLRDKGMQSIVIHRGRFTYCLRINATWSQWKCDENAKFAIICAEYRSPIDHISCSDTGNMADEHRSIVLNVLKECSTNNKMQTSETKKN